MYELIELVAKRIILYVFLLNSFAVLSQEKFEGKIYYEITYTDPISKTPSDAEKAVFFYKKNQARFENEDNSSSIVYDYERGDQLTIVNIPSLGYMQAVLSNIPRVESYKSEKLSETKTILGHKCNKITASTNTNNEVSTATGYADFNYKIVIGLDNQGNAIFSPLFFEQVSKLADGTTVTRKVISLQEDFYDDRIFSLDYPAGFNFLDDRKEKIYEVPKGYEPDEDWEFYSKLITPELEEIVATALKSEDFDTATLINTIIEKRKKGKLYRSKTIQQLQDMITAALNEENYEAAEEMKTEIINRSK